MKQAAPSSAEANVQSVGMIRPGGVGKISSGGTVSGSGFLGFASSEIMGSGSEAGWRRNKRLAAKTIPVIPASIARIR